MGNNEIKKLGSSSSIFGTGNQGILCERRPSQKSKKYHKLQSRLNDEELLALAKSGGLLNIDKAFELFGQWIVFATSSNNFRE